MAVLPGHVMHFTAVVRWLEPGRPDPRVSDLVGLFAEQHVDVTRANVTDHDLIREGYRLAPDPG
jgi:hypothetical protein